MYYKIDFKKYLIKIELKSMYTIVRINMKQKKIILAIMGLLSFSVHSMEIPGDRFQCGKKWLPTHYENDVKLGNISYCPTTDKYEVSDVLTEKLGCFSKLPPLHETRSALGWIGASTDRENMYRTVVVATDKDQIEAYINFEATEEK